MEQKIDRIMQMTNVYLERFGKVLIGIYYLPPMAENGRFMVFINSLSVTLRRMDLMPEYSWFMTADGGHYLVLLINGYFRNDLSEVTPVINRLWQNQNTTPLTTINYILLTTENQNYEKFHLQQFLYSYGLNQMISQNYHQRTFGSSRNYENII